MQGLSADDLTRYKEQLQALAKDLSKTLASSADRSKPVELTTAQGRVSRADAMQQQQMALAEERRIKARMQGVAAALRRVADGAYGECTRCGEDIAPRRLDVRPEGPLCVQCVRAVGG